MTKKLSIATSGGQYGEATQTLLFFDWDDTLFPTHALFRTWGLDYNVEVDTNLDDGLSSQLKRWQEALLNHLNTAAAVSERVIILTNSRRPWVQRCVRRFAPEVQLLFEQSQSNFAVVYANEVGPKSRRRTSLRPDENELVETLTKAKQAAMKKEAKSFYSRYPGQTWKNVLSFGDMPYEHHAVQEVTFRRVAPARERVRTKAVTEPTSPSIGELTLRLQFGARMLSAFVLYDGDINLDLHQAEDPPAAIATAVSMPKLAQLGFPLYAWGKGPEPTDEEQASAIEELTRLVQNRLCERLAASRGLDDF